MPQDRARERAMLGGGEGGGAPGAPGNCPDALADTAIADGAEPGSSSEVGGAAG